MYVCVYGYIHTCVLDTERDGNNVYFSYPTQEGAPAFVDDKVALPTPYTLYSEPCTLNPAPCTLHPAP